MSYHIIYKIQATKLDNGKFSLSAETGCNNVYEARGKRWSRARDTYQEKMVTSGLCVSVEELTIKLDQFLQKCYSQYPEVPFEEFKNKFGWYVGVAVYGKSTHTTRWNDVKNMYLRSVK